MLCMLLLSESKFFIPERSCISGYSLPQGRCVIIVCYVLEGKRKNVIFVLSLYTGITEKKSEVKGRIQVSGGR